VEIITITVQAQEDGQIAVAAIKSNGLELQMAVSACELAARQFRQAAIEAEVERRLAEREAQNGDADE
jgi:hypothetical protein